MPEPQAIFFDFDGVLLDTEPVHWACWAEVLATLGITLTWEYYRDFAIGIDDRDMLRNIARMADPPRAWETLWALYPAKKKLFQERMTSPPFEPALVRALPELRRTHRLAVVSSSSCSEIEPLLIAAGIRQHFETIVGGDNVTRHKPAPDPYLLAAERLGVTTALVLEDSEAGIASGRAAGFEVLPVRHPSEVAELLRKRLSGSPLSA
ncbi:MAG: HAD-superfamily hydrolase, subfamily variant 3 [Candidatus Solibacter sp.]|nr:HAD-superfamily hydrolase, subfamily variant 3 [Candidatus Solibacter sp.]